MSKKSSNVGYHSIYGESLALLTDLYELTMAQGYYKMGWADHHAAFSLCFRRRPFNGNMAVCAGLETAVDFLEKIRFESNDLAYLSQVQGEDGTLIFDPRFLDYLSTFSFRCNIDAMREGTPVFPYEPLVRVEGPIIDAQIVESILLNIINFQTLIATKSSRICYAARPDPVVEFGLRRAQGIDGAISAVRAAFIGGCQSTSNVFAGKQFDLPVKGTHAHSWIMAFDNELASFEEYAKIMPNNCIFLIDTYNTIQGAKNAVKVGKEMRKHGHEMIGVRLDSGDLAELSKQVRKILDEGGFKKAKIMASNELDEYIIADLKHQGAKIDIWGVGTHLVTGREQPALDGVYKLSAVKEKGGEWKEKLKISEQIAKTTNPGILQVRRYRDKQGYVADMMYDLLSPLPKEHVILDPVSPATTKTIAHGTVYEDLLIPILRHGKRVYDFPSLHEVHGYAQEQLSMFPPSMRRFTNPQYYLAGLERSLYEKKIAMMQSIETL